MSSALKAQLIAAALGATLLIGTTIAAHAATSPNPPSVLFFNQKAEGKSVTLEYAHLPSNGYVVIYGADKEGKPVGEALGYVELKAGDHRNVKVELNRTAEAGQRLWASLYSDRDQKPGFDKTADLPFWGDQLPWQNQIVIQ